MRRKNGSSKVFRKFKQVPKLSIYSRISCIICSRLHAFYKMHELLDNFIFLRRNLCYPFSYSCSQIVPKCRSYPSNAIWTPNKTAQPSQRTLTFIQQIPLQFLKDNQAASTGSVSQLWFVVALRISWKISRTGKLPPEISIRLEYSFRRRRGRG